MTKYKVFVQETRTIMLEVEAPNDIEACNLVNEDINKYPVIDEEVTFWEVDYAEEIDNVTNEIAQPKVTITPQQLEGDISTVTDDDYASKVDTLVDNMVASDDNEEEELPELTIQEQLDYVKSRLNIVHDSEGC